MKNFIRTNLNFVNLETLRSITDDFCHEVADRLKVELSYSNAIMSNRKIFFERQMYRHHM